MGARFGPVELWSLECSINRRRVERECLEFPGDTDIRGFTNAHTQRLDVSAAKPNKHFNVVSRRQTAITQFNDGDVYLVKIDSRLFEQRPIDKRACRPVKTIGTSCTCQHQHLR